MCRIHDPGYRSLAQFDLASMTTRMSSCSVIMASLFRGIRSRKQRRDLFESPNDCGNRHDAPPRPSRPRLKVWPLVADYRLPADAVAHAVAMDATSRNIAAGGSLYPDHVIFLGTGSVVAEAGETAAEITARFADSDLPAPVAILVPDHGVLMRKDATAGAEAMARCLADVTARLGADAEIAYLSAEDNRELLGWDQEKYRQSLNAQQRFGAGGVST